MNNNWFNKLWRGAACSALAVFASASLANTVTSAGGTAAATINVNNDWGAGYCATVAISNHFQPLERFAHG